MKALIFDMGGVLIDLDLDACRKAFREGLGFKEIDTILDPSHQKGIIGDMEEGLVSAEEFRDYVMAGSNPGVTCADVDRALSQILVRIRPYKIEMLRRLSEKYDIYMLSNNNPIASQRASEMFAEAGFTMENDFKKCYLSYQMKMLKPSFGFYRAVMEDIALPADQMLFIDDSKANVEAAIKAGLPAIWYEPGSDLNKLLEDYLRQLTSN